MGVGKSVVGRRLADRLGVPFVDLDAEIEAETGRSIARQFVEEGEAAFRRREQGALRTRTPAAGAVVATGGGLPADPELRRWMSERGTVVWLDAPFEAAWQRIGGDRSRPLASDEAAARALYRRRREAYADSELRIEIEAGEGVDRIADRIVRRLAGDGGAHLRSTEGAE